MHLKTIHEVREQSYALSRDNGYEPEEAMAQAMHDSGNMGYIYGSLMAIPVKLILLTAFVILTQTPWLDDFSGMHRYAIVFGAAWAWWFIAVVFVLKMRHWAGWVVYLSVHALLGLMVISALMSN